MEVVDDGHSGTNFDRPGIKRVLELVRQRKVAAILVKDLSRFGRNYKEVGSYLEQVFPFLGVRFYICQRGYDSNEYIGSTGGLDIACKALVHDLYSRDISRKVTEQPICPPAAWRLLLQRCSLRLCEKQ